jgi:hypothetical protein
MVIEVSKQHAATCVDYKCCCCSASLSTPNKDNLYLLRGLAAGGLLGMPCTPHMRKHIHRPSSKSKQQLPKHAMKLKHLCRLSLLQLHRFCTACCRDARLHRQTVAHLVAGTHIRGARRTHEGFQASCCTATTNTTCCSSNRAATASVGPRCCCCCCC